MKPTESNKPLNTELIAHVRERLLEHEEAYVPGAWEKFNAPQEKKKVLWLPIIGAVAALLAIVFTAVLLVNKKPVERELSVVKNKSLQKENTDVIVSKSDKLKDQIVKTDRNNYNPISEKNNVVAANNKVKKITPEQVVTEKLTTALISKPQASLVTKLEQNEEKNVIVTENLKDKKPEEVIAKNVPKQTDIIAFFENETKRNKENGAKEHVAKKDSKITFGLVVSPSFGNVNKLNMGYGLSLDYSLSDKFSLNSGIAYNQMAAAKGADLSNFNTMNSPSSSAVIAKTSSRSLESVEERVAGIDIPLELKYNINKNIYANVGVSAFAVISQKRNNTFIESNVEQRIQDMPNGLQQMSSVLVTDRITEKAESTSVNDYSYLGFYNLSFGYKKKIAKHNSFAIEPFLKLPMKPVSAENLRLIGTGVKLKFDF